jgi:hypothetical protein
MCFDFDDIVLLGILFFSLSLAIFAYASCHSRWNIVTEAISLQATIVFGLLRYTRNDKSQDNHTAQVPFATLRSR